MDKEINKIIDNLENCFGIFDYVITPIESNLLVSYIKTLQQQCKKQKEIIDKAMIELDTIINDLENHGDEAPAPSKEELYKVFNILKEVSE